MTNTLMRPFCGMMIVVFGLIVVTCLAGDSDSAVTAFEKGNEALEKGDDSSAIAFFLRFYPPATGLSHGILLSGQATFCREM